jgi:uncharacterized protein YodC (DUF2158 family)
MAFNIGDVVQLKSGGPLMTVANPNARAGGQSVVGCVWFDERKPCSEVFPADVLKLVNQGGTR